MQVLLGLLDGDVCGRSLAGHSHAMHMAHGMNLRSYVRVSRIMTDYRTMCGFRGAASHASQGRGRRCQNGGKHQQGRHNAQHEG